MSTRKTGTTNHTCLNQQLRKSSKAVSLMLYLKALIKMNEEKLESKTLLSIFFSLRGLTRLTGSLNSNWECSASKHYYHRVMSRLLVSNHSSARRSTIAMLEIWIGHRRTKMMILNIPSNMKEDLLKLLWNYLKSLPERMITMPISEANSKSLDFENPYI